MRDPDIHAKWETFREFRRTPPRNINDSLAVDLIADMLLDPDWGVGMLEDISEIVQGTGRDLTNDTDEPTWDRH